VKLTKSKAEREAWKRRVKEDKIGFALLPRYCRNTGRWVWLERIKRRALYHSYDMTYHYYTYEIGYDFMGIKEKE
jgi:hypothetical protein